MPMEFAYEVARISTMTQKIPFIKMHGLGNDFVIIESTHAPDRKELAGFAAKILDRRLGVGGDQLVIYTQPSPEDIVDMAIYNNDASIVEACGNASRCICKLICEQENINCIKLHVAGRTLDCKIIDDEYQIDMGPVSFEEDWMPVQSELMEIAAQYNIDEESIICADIGNPHLILFGKVSPEDRIKIGQELQGSNYFPDGVNVNFAELNDGSISLQVYERGAGPTLACGSGGCCTYASAMKLGLVNGPTKVHFKLGALTMSAINGSILMQGPAEFVYSGEYRYG